nr:hypothetical protein [Bisgaardia hudsonensis]
MEWIKENAKRFAEQEGISLEEAESKLIERAVKSVDYLASKKIDSEKYQDKNIAADAFLLQAGKNYFKEFDKDSYYSPYVNATLLQKYDKAHDGYFSKRFQPLVKNSLYTKVVSDTLEGVGNYGKALVTNPSSTGEATSKAMRDGFYEYMNCLKEIDCIKGEFNTLGNSASDIINAKFPTDSHVALNSLYGKEVSHEVKDIAASRVLGVATEITPIIKGVKDLTTLGKIKLPTKGVLSNKDVGISWGQGIDKQGYPWEQYLMSYLPEGTTNLNKIKSNFKTFDHLLPDGTAVSAKTMDTIGSKTYQNPKRITSQLNKYVDDMVSFDRDSKQGTEFILENEDIVSKELYLAIPNGTTKQQMNAINESVRYADSQGVKIIVKKVK